MNKEVIKNATTGKIFDGVVVATKNIKTVIVTVTSTHRHPLYKKAVKTTRRFAAHNDSLTLAVGDHVRIKETRPISKTKHFRVLEKAV